MTTGSLPIPSGAQCVTDSVTALALIPLSALVVVTVRVMALAGMLVAPLAFAHMITPVVITGLAVMPLPVPAMPRAIAILPRTVAVTRRYLGGWTCDDTLVLQGRLGRFVGLRIGLRHRAQADKGSKRTEKYGFPHNLSSWSRRPGIGRA